MSAIPRYGPLYEELFQLWLQTMEQDMPIKLCKDCEYIEGGAISPSPMSRCKHPDLVDPVMGLPALITCKEMRSENGRCGSEGVLFVQRKQEPADAGYF